jgi:hypothetical protein
LGAIILAVVFVQGLVMPMVHLAVESHRYCSVHQRIEHVEHSAKGHAATVPHGDDFDSSANGESLSTDDAFAFNPTECGVLSFVRTPQASGDIGSLTRINLPPPSVQQQSVPTSYEVSSSPFSPLFVSPSTSPPVVAS